MSRAVWAALPPGAGGERWCTARVRSVSSPLAGSSLAMGLMLFADPPERGRYRARALRFEKWNALGNDYVIVERDDLPVRADA